MSLNKVITLHILEILESIKLTQNYPMYHIGLGFIDNGKLFLSYSSI